ncbi:restriction endonuclease subunit S [Vibrio chagasii]|uniref:Type I restriction modification DNA specificity domain-containing protein n=1 Tax=Vibrio chagasii TaxID=170679 RepID=A0A7Y4DRU4_9VIBR|nr:restriction endonuclease subunit S [Vibrio chagasii]NOH33652.1 hypothetical protein [Vibrio chagasii]
MQDLIEKAVEGLKLDRSDWKLVKFGDVAIQQKKTVDRENTELTRYVKGEHMYSEDVHLREWGELEDEYLGPAFIRKFEEGDILYGSRRTYLRKVVVAPFDGITSNTTFVIKPNEALIYRSLLPYLMLSEGFSQHSISNSKGSVNPYINWKDIANYEFLLPPLHIQESLYELISSLDDVLEKKKELAHKLISTQKLFFESTKTNFHEESKTLKEAVIKIIAGKSPQGYPKPAELGEYGVLKVSAVGDGKYIQSENKAIVDQCKYDPKYEVKERFILVTRANANLSGIGRACIVNQTREGLMMSDKTLRLIPDSELVEDRFLLQLLRSKEYRNYIESVAGGTDAKNISQKLLLEAPIWLPNKEIQYDITNKLIQFDKSISSAELVVKNVKSAYMTTINQVF